MNQIITIYIPRLVKMSVLACFIIYSFLNFAHSEKIHTDFYTDTYNAVTSSPSLSKLFDLQYPIPVIADAFYNVISHSAEQLGWPITSAEELGQEFRDAILKGFDANAYLDVVLDTLEKYLIHINRFESIRPGKMAEYFIGHMQDAADAILVDEPQSYIQALVDAIRNFLLGSIISRDNPDSISSLFINKISWTGKTSVTDIISNIAPEIFLPAGLSSSLALDRINDLASDAVADLKSKGQVDIKAFVDELSTIKAQIHKDNPDLKDVGLNIGTRLEGIGALVQIINSANFLDIGNIDTSNLSFETGLVTEI